MFFIRVLRYFRGYLRISVSGRNVERFINICMRRNILLWDIKRVKTNTSTMKISVKGFRDIREIAKKSACSIRIVGKRGLPFSFFRHRRRRGLAIGVGIFATALLVMTSFVWRIEVVGNNRVSEESILISLKEAGISEGRWRYGLDLTAIQNRVLLHQPELSWVGINVLGSKVLVSVSEEIPDPVIVDRKTPCNLVASKDGMIETVVATDGVSVVHAGDTVKAGDLLISGIDDSPRNGVRYLHAMGSVRAKTWSTYSKTVSRYGHKLEKSGEVKTHFTIEILNFDINFFKKGSIPYTKYDTINHVSECRITKNFYLPVAFKTTRYEELVPIEFERTLDEAKEDALNEIEKEQGTYQTRHISWIPSGDAEGTLTVTYETIEEIAVMQPIDQGGI